MKIQSFIPDFFVPQRYKRADSYTLRRARLLVQVSFLTSIFSSFYLVLHLSWDMYWSSWAMVLNAGFFLLLPFLFRSGRLPLLWAVNGFNIVGSLGVLLSSAAQGFIDSSAIIYLALSPVIALLLGNRRTAWVWTVIAYSTVMACGWLYGNGILLGNELPPEHRTFYISNGVAGFVLLVFWVVMVFQKTTNRALEQVEQERKRSDDLLHNILPDEVAAELKDHGSSAARQYEAVSVLFTDFVNFTGMAQELSPQELVKELNECFTAFDAIIDRNGLEKIKTIGDAYMAVCGLPSPDRHHARKTVQAAVEILSFIEERRSRKHAFEIRIGISSGPVVAGIVGVKKFAYDIWGDTVNMAARMEQHGGAGKVNISGDTYELVKDEYACTPRGRIPAKNKGEVEMYFVSMSDKKELPVH